MKICSKTTQADQMSDQHKVSLVVGITIV